MKRRAHHKVAGLVQAASQAHDAGAGAQHKLRRKVSQADDDVRPDAPDLLAQEGRARLNLLRPGLRFDGGRHLMTLAM